MTQQDIADALTARLQLFPNSPPVAWDGVPFRPTLPLAYLSERLAAYTRQAIGTGPNASVQHDGAYSIVVFSPADDGRAVAARIAGRLVAHFGRGTSLVAAGVPVIVVQVGEQPGYANNDWYAVPVVVTFTALEQP